MKLQSSSAMGILPIRQIIFLFTLITAGHLSAQDTSDPSPVSSSPFGDKVSSSETVQTQTDSSKPEGDGQVVEGSSSPFGVTVSSAKDEPVAKADSEKPEASTQSEESGLTAFGDKISSPDSASPTESATSVAATTNRTVNEIDPVTWVIEHKEARPAEVHLTKSTSIPLVAAGKTIGQITKPAGSSLHVDDLSSTEVKSLLNGVCISIPISNTDLAQEAKMIVSTSRNIHR